MKKVLIIGYPFPLRQGGSPRLLGLAKYLPEFGWQPIIVTAPLDERPDDRFRIVETDYRDALGFWKRLFRLDPNEDIRKQVERRFGVTAKNSLIDFIITRVGEVATYPDYERGWEPFAVKAGEKLFQEEKIKAIISTSAPVTTHFVAKRLKNRYQIPWVADLRDLWSQNHNYSYGPVRKWFDRRLELKTLSMADALVTVSQPWADKLSTLHKNKTTYAITNGFDPETVNMPPADLTTKFTITYTGIIYPRKQDTTKLFAALSDLISDRVIDPNSLEIRFYGTSEDWLQKEIEQYGLSSVTNQYGLVPRDIALEKQRESQVLLLLAWEDRKNQGAYGTKTFEYLAARRPILATGESSDVLRELLNETNAGICALTVEDIKCSLKELYREYKLNGRVAYRGDESKANKYNYQQMAEKLSKILDHLQSSREMKPREPRKVPGARNWK